jgi:hypothetical protein
VQFPKKACRDTLRQTCVFASGGFGARSVDALLFMLRWAWCGFHKKHAGACYAKLLFLHVVASACVLVHSVASGVQNVITLFFMLDWDRYGFDKKCTRTRYAELVFLNPVESPGHVVHSSASGV